MARVRRLFRHEQASGLLMSAAIALALVAAVALRGAGARFGAVTLLLCIATVAIGLAAQLVLARLGIGAVS